MARFHEEKRLILRWTTSALTRGWMHSEGNHRSWDDAHSRILPWTKSVRTLIIKFIEWSFKKCRFTFITFHIIIEQTLHSIHPESSALSSESAPRLVCLSQPIVRNRLYCACQSLPLAQAHEITTAVLRCDRNSSKWVTRGREHIQISDYPLGMVGRMMMKNDLHWLWEEQSFQVAPIETITLLSNGKTWKTGFRVSCSREGIEWITPRKSVWLVDILLAKVACAWCNIESIDMTQHLQINSTSIHSRWSTIWELRTTMDQSCTMQKQPSARWKISLNICHN